MRSSLLTFIPFAAVTAAVAFACGGSSNGSGFGNDGGSGSSSGTSSGSSGSSSGTGSSSGGCLTCGDGALQDGPGPCSNLQCKGATCTTGPTSITGTVYDPAGNLPLYNVYVYIPNTTPQPITAGSPTCTQCEAPASGNPVIGASTDANGKFTIQKGPSDPWDVPVGSNIPLVIQVGKWRKQLVIPQVQGCAANDLDTVFNSGSGTARQLRLPAKSSEGDMPLMAFTSGCDPAECFLRHLGIDDSEFVPPTSPTGHVHFYTSWDGPTGGQAASSVSGGNQPSDTYNWWSSSTNLLKYDIIFNACECVPNDRGATAYGAMHGYLNSGGRLFTTHFYYNWFASPTGPADFNGVAAWNPGGATSGANYYVDTSFPKGQAYGQWLVANGVATGSGANTQIALTDTRNDIDQSGPPAYAGSTRWIYDANSAGGNPYGSEYISFNTPVGQPVTSQCGRAVFSDVHLSGTSNDSTFPSECSGQSSSYEINEKALEFLFFDLSSCVQNDTQPPPPPPPVQ